MAMRVGTAIACLLMLGGTSADATSAGEPPAEVAGHPDPLALLDDPDPVLAANKRLVFDMWRNVVNAGHVEAADQLLLESYIQHSPVLPTGRAAFKQIFSAVERRDVPKLVSPPIVSMVAQGDLVVMALREELPEPRGDGLYTTTHFNLFRVEDGRLAEHWHSVAAEPGPGVLPPDQGGPQLVTGARGAAQLAMLEATDPKLAANKRLVFDAWREVFEAGRENLVDMYFAESYVEHDPNGRSGREGLRSRIASLSDAPVQSSIEAPLVAVLAQEDRVVLVTGREHSHPHRPGKTYTTTVFDMFRITDGLISEHWSGASKPGGSLGPYVDRRVQGE
ncbi:nuclear transport factor 2 family protein [Croceibacterium sp. LX-88]|uniref:Nuclear transport factor 2 family protein n=1 Tax=Croceibacterium selenioxidans TaxID=2838833 RepID=A0ABS5W4K0_9SPHN|nr:nuclear transport factor 2 family protein [Croceibacterium selenioxidans]MBT2134673.1 nuclear transport factor 2 family protein [Croceibacterium selenioxidans]